MSCVRHLRSAGVASGFSRSVRSALRVGGKDYPVYVPDQVSRGRSGFNQAVFNDVRAGAAPPAAQPALRRFSDEVVWLDFRFGPKGIRGNSHMIMQDKNNVQIADLILSWIDDNIGTSAQPATAQEARR